MNKTLACCTLVLAIGGGTTAQAAEGCLDPVQSLAQLKQVLTGRVRGEVIIDSLSDGARTVGHIVDRLVSASENGDSITWIERMKPQGERPTETQYTLTLTPTGIVLSAPNLYQEGTIIACSPTHLEFVTYDSLYGLASYNDMRFPSVDILTVFAKMTAPDGSVLVTGYYSLRR